MSGYVEGENEDGTPDVGGGPDENVGGLPAEIGLAGGDGRHYAGIVVLPDLTARPGSDPLQWRDIIKRFGRDALPYKQPQEEWTQNPFALNLNTMLYRWAGLGFEQEIVDLCTNPKWALERDKVQYARDLEAEPPDTRDPDYLRKMNARHTMILRDEIEKLKFEIDNKVEVKVDTYFDPHSGTSYKENLRPLSSAALSQKRKDLKSMMETFQELTGQKKKTVEHEIGGTLRDLLLEKRKREGRPISSTLVSNRPVGEITEGSIVEDVGLNGVQPAAEIVYARPRIPAEEKVHDEL